MKTLHVSFYCQGQSIQIYNTGGMHPSGKMALPVLNPVESTHFIRGFPKVDHSGRSARIVLGQINSAKKTTSNRT